MIGVVWPFGPTLRCSMTVSIVWPSVLEMPAPRHTIRSSMQNQDLRPVRVCTANFNPIPSAAFPSSRAPPVQVFADPRPVPSDRVFVSTVVPGIRYLFAVGQYSFGQWPSWFGR